MLVLSDSFVMLYLSSEWTHVTRSCANTEGLYAFPSQEQMLRNSSPRRGWTLPHTCRRSLAPERAEGWAPASDHSVRHAILWASSSAAIPVDTLSLYRLAPSAGLVAWITAESTWS